MEIEDGEARVPSHRIPRGCSTPSASKSLLSTGETRDALQMASVLGGRFSVDELAAVMDRPSAALLGPVREAIGAGLIIEDGERLSFRHDLVRESIDASLPMAFRRALQRRALDVMLEHGAPPSDVARLVIDVAQPGDLPAIEMLRRAAAEIARVSPAVAAPLSRRALELAPRESPLYGELVEETVGLLVSANLASEAMQLIALLTPGLVDPLAEARARFAVVPMMMQYEASEAVNQCRLALELPRLPATLRSQLFSFMSCSLELLGETQAAAAAAADAVSIPGVAERSGQTPGHPAFLERSSPLQTATGAKRWCWLPRRATNRHQRRSTRSRICGSTTDGTRLSCSRRAIWTKPRGSSKPENAPR